MRIPFIEAKNYTDIAPGRRIDLIVIHDMEAPESRDTAENVAAWMAGPTAPQASYHYGVDSDSVVQSVADHDIAWGAPGANHNGLQIEHAGYARQTKGDWLDAYSRAELDNSARLVARLCSLYRIPAIHLMTQALKQGAHGIVTHADCTKAFGPVGGHSDPGVNFPMTRYIQLVKSYMTGPPAAENRLPGPRPIPKWFWAWATWRMNGRIWERPPAPDNPPPWAWKALEILAVNRKRGTK